MGIPALEAPYEALIPDTRLIVRIHPRAGCYDYRKGERVAGNDPLPHELLAVLLYCEYLPLELGVCRDSAE